MLDNDTLLDQCESFLMEHYSKSMTWKYLRDWLKWYAIHGLYSIIVDENKKIVALGLARPVQNAHDGLIDYNYDPLGKCLFIDMAICFDEVSLTMLYKAIFQKIGQVDQIAFRRNGGIVKEYEFNKFSNKLFNIRRLYGRRHTFTTTGT